MEETEASVYRGSQKSETFGNVTDSLNTHNSRMNYANVTKTTAVPIFPKKEQAIILNSVDNLTLTDYIEAVGELVPQPKNITHASYMSNKRVCIYLSSIGLVDNIVSNHTSLKIKECDVSIRRLITPARRVILSSVSPSMPHEFLEKILKDLKLKLVSPISFLRAGIHNEKYAHILSFRRQVYIQTDDSIELPSSVVVKFEDTNYRIFLNFDEMKCFNCKQEGHIAKYCPTHSDTQAQTIDLSQTAATQENLESEGQPGNYSETEITSPETLANLANTNTATNQLKRNAPSTTDSISTQDTNDDLERSTDKIYPAEADKDAFKTPNRAKQPKKLKRSDSEESLTPMDDIMKPVKKCFETPDPPFLLTFEEITDFLSNVKGNQDPLSVARNYTNNIPELLDILRRIYPFFTHRSIKNRCTRIRKKILEQLQMEIEPTDSDGSQMSF